MVPLAAENGATGSPPSSCLDMLRRAAGAEGISSEDPSQDPYRYASTCIRILHLASLAFKRKKKITSCLTFLALSMSVIMTPSHIHCSLRSCILALPGTGAPAALPPLIDSPPKPSSSPEDDSSRFSLALLPDDVVSRILSALDADTLKAAAATCRHLRAQAADVAPGLQLSLYPHQRAATRWMLKREAPHAPLPHPSYQQFLLGAGDGDGWCIWGDTATGELRQEPPEQVADFRGGLLCDDPGLGKTITSIGLILRTKGTLPDAPAGAEVLELAHPEGSCRYRLYCVSESLATSGSRLQRVGTRAGGHGRRTRSAVAAGAAVLTPGPEGSREDGMAVSTPDEEVLESPPPPKRLKVKGRAGSVDVGVATPDLPAEKQGLLGQSSEDDASMGPAAYSEAASLATTVKLDTPTSSSMSHASSATSGEDDSPDTWLQCDLCHKWRRLPEDYCPPEGLWSCYQHPHPGFRSCTVRGDEQEEEEHLTSAPG